ncbi:MAG: Asymmetrical Bis(5'-nucleosyl)-tetraphosphatase [Parcubacteria group bacterium GW2011_GWF2_39_13b]|nr:MAG: Asymmetrical Bis(5'-nucleosyl)-tetraphosphatase [Parcubacteria group bacterium GW2011_GWF2_39_13b]
MIFQKPPKDFNPRFEIASSFVQYKDEYLFLLRRNEKDEGNKFGIPTGRIEKGENHLEAMLRELKEETGISTQDNDLLFLGESFVRFPGIYDFKAYVYHLTLINKPQVIINPLEHKNFLWTSKTDALALSLVQDLDNWIKYFIYHK